MATSLARVLEKKRGVAGQASVYRRLHQETGVAAYPYEHSYPAPGSVVTYLPVQRLGPASEFEHLAQHGDFAPCRELPKHVQHFAGGVGIRVVAVVDNVDTVSRETLPTHLAGRERPHGVSCRSDVYSEQTRYRQRRKNVPHRVASLHRA